MSGMQGLILGVFEDGGAAPPPGTNDLLLEDSSFLLLEDGSKILLEDN